MNKLTFKSFALVLLVCLTLMLGACGDNNNGNNIDPIVPPDDNTVLPDNNADTTIYGFIKAFDTVENNITLDVFELITEADTERITALGLDRERDILNGYHIYNIIEESDVYALSAEATLNLSDFHYLGSEFYQQRYHSVTEEDGDLDLLGEGDNLDDANLTARSLSWQGRYSGSEAAKLSEALADELHIPFALTLRDGVVIKIEEMDNIYR